MSSQTPNINLTLPVGSENVSRQIINDNNTKIDTAFGGTAGRELLGYKENGDTASQAISDGSFVVWKGNLYKANGNISQGATLSVSNLTAVSSGGFNDLQGQVDSLSDSIATLIAPVLLLDTNWISDTSNHVYSCPNWYDYQLLIIQYCFYGNVMDDVTATTDWFNTTNNGMRVLMRNQQLVIYKNDGQSVNIQYTETGLQYRKVRIYGVLKK